MKRLIATALILISTGSLAWAQAPAANDPHHPPQSATPAPAQPAPQQPAPGGAQGMGGMPMMGNEMPMMGMMRDMSTMNMMGMMRSMGMMGPGSPGMAMIDRIEGRIAFLRAELKITDAQAGAWNAFADVLRANARKLAEVRSAAMSLRSGGAQSLLERLDAQEQWLAARLEGTRALKSALATLSAALSDDQKKTADELLAPQMGMTMMSLMPGRMQPGPMQPR